MPHFRNIKLLIRNYINSSAFDGINNMPSDLKNMSPEQMISPLFACLLDVEPFCSRAAQLLGFYTVKVYEKEHEKARLIVRRLIWQMNEESGNIGWGIPQAFAQVLVQSEDLAKEYHRILISYIRELEGDSNFCDYAPLRVYCFLAVETLLDRYPHYTELATLPLLQGLKDKDEQCQKEARRLAEKYKLIL